MVKQTLGTDDYQKQAKKLKKSLKSSNNVSEKQYCNELEAMVKGETIDANSYNELAKQAENLGYKDAAAAHREVGQQETTHHDLDKHFYDTICKGGSN